MDSLVKDPVIITACADHARMRVDQFLVMQLPDYSRSLIAKFLKAGAITTRDGLDVKASQLINGTEEFIFARPTPTISGMLAQPLPLDIIYSDDHIAVINKPSGMITHPGAGVKDGTLCNALLHYFPGMAIGNALRPGIIHRLDKDTSGLIVVAKTEMAHRILSEDFKERRVKKNYRILCHGTFIEQAFMLKTGHARHPHHRLRFTTKIPLDKCHGQNVRMAHTDFVVVKNYLGIALLTAQIHTGRTHQIRAHLADIDHPILGDEIYGGKRALPSRAPEILRASVAELKGQALHAERLSFAHPITKEALNFFVPPPKDFSRVERIFV